MIEREIEKNFFTPRDYQIELLDKACKRNIIVQLGTGAGKTFIAVLLLKEYGLQLNAPFSKEGKRAFFIVNSVALVEQQASHIKCHTTFEVGQLHGNLNNDIWDNKDNFQIFLEKHQIIVLTAQIFLDTLNHGFFDMRKSAILIFDECHHAMGSKHPYRLIMENYAKLEKDSRPRILGLTASLINDKCPPQKLETKLQALENALHCVIETASDLVALSKFGARPEQHIVLCKNFDIMNTEYVDLYEYLDNVKMFCMSTQEFDKELDFDPTKIIIEGITKTQLIFKQLGPWAAWKVADKWEKEIFKNTKQKYLPNKAIDFFLLGYTCLLTIKRRLESIMKNVRDITTLEQYVPHKVIQLLKLLSVYSPENQERIQADEKLSAIIFVEQRYVAYALNLILKFVSKNDPRFKYLQSDFVIGFSGSSFASDDSQSLHKRLDEVLRKFRKGDLNLLVSTNVLEEGVDVRTCNLVIRFDRALDFRSYVQSKGRARKAGANYVMFIEDTVKEECNNDLKNFVQIEQFLLKRFKTVHNPEFEYRPPDNIDEIYKPYRVESTGASVKMTTAIQLINRYCAKLPSDIFTRLVPQNRIIPIVVGGVTKYKAELLLPINSPLKEPIRLETPMDSKKLAQMRVALEGCKRLHQKGELNDYLLPVGRDSIANLLDDDPDEFCPGLNAKVGSSRRKQLYDRRSAKSLHDAAPIEGKDLFIYVFEMELLKEPSVEHNPKCRKFTRPEEYEDCFGFLSSLRLPKIPAFPAYLRQGDMRVHVKLASQMINLSNQKLLWIKHFHHYIFDKVLQLYKGNLEFKMGEKTPVNTLIVPLNRVTKDGIIDYTINMNYVEKVVVSKATMPKQPDEEERKKYKFKAEDYRDAVVMPWYRNVEQPAFFYVAEILEDMSPKSAFPDAEYGSFNEYFIKKYNLIIYDQKQALLDVDFTSNRLNLLLPRPGGIKKKPKTEQSQQQIFVPELMDKHPINATLWNLIAALPSCFYRMNHLLLADELRVKIAQDALKINPTVPDEFEWEPLTYPATYEEKQSLIVSKIQQLRELTKAREKENGVIDSSRNDDEFEIGVWDPSVSDDNILGRLDNDKKGNIGIDETVGLVGSTLTSGDLSDGDDEDFTVICEYKQKFKNNPMLGIPRDNIEECGWGEPNDISTDASSSFQIVGGDNQMIDMKSLQADLERDILMTNSKNQDLSTDVRNIHKPNLKQAIIKKELLNELNQFDDREKLKDREELVDLTKYEDEENANNVATDVIDSDNDIEDLNRGEELKQTQDATYIQDAKLSEREITAEELKETFSFAAPSPLAAGLLSKCPSTSSGADLMHLNPYGVSPCKLLTALTTSNATDGINLERLETIGDSFLKYAVTDFLYHTHSDQHEGKLSFARSKEVSNCNLYRLGKKLGIPSLIVGTKFEVQDSWLPPCSVPPDFKAPNSDDAEEKDRFYENILEGNVNEDNVVKPTTGWDEADGYNNARQITDGVETIEFAKPTAHSTFAEENSPLPHNHLTQQYISDKSIADAVEALIGAHLLVLGPRPTLKVMKWIGLNVIVDDELKSADPLLHFIDTKDNPDLSMRQLKEMYKQFQFENIENTIGYKFNNKAYLLQAFTHASYYKNRITGCYQRLEFLGDAVLDYMITRFLYEDGRQYSPGVLTDLRSALVNNTIFASLAVKYNFHKHFIAMCPRLHHMIGKFVKLCSERNFFDANFNAEMYMVTTEEEIDEGQEEDIEVPKALSDVFESIAGAVYLDSDRNLDNVWRIFHNLMKQTIDECCANPPRSPIRELMELEPGKTRFSKMERIIESGKVRVTVDVGGKMRFTGMGRNYRIAKTTAAKRALRYLKTLEEQKLRDAERKVGSS